MNWIPLNDTLVAEGLNAKEAAVVMESAEELPGICRGLAARIRSCVLAGGRAVLGGEDETYIPEALRGEAVAILRLRLLVRFALVVTEERKREAELAEQRLDTIARGEYPLPEDTVAASPTYHGRPQRWASPKHGGII